MIDHPWRLERLRHTAALLACAVELSLAACGGGGGESATSPGGPVSAPPPPQSITGLVVDGAIQGATVCLDLNRNGGCDVGEPTSAATDVNGRYTIEGLTQAQVDAAYPVVAVVPVGALDAGIPVATRYQMSAPGGKPAVISPVTHLVQTGVASGLSLAAAEAAVAVQLGIRADNLYVNPAEAGGADSVRLAVLVPSIVSALQAGVLLEVGPAVKKPADYQVTYFELQGPGGTVLQTEYSDNTPDASGRYTYFKTDKFDFGGVAAMPSELWAYIYLSPSGWVFETPALPHSRSPGNPFVVTRASGRTEAHTVTEIDVAGQSMASVVTRIQDLSVNSASTVAAINPTGLTGVMPAGARIHVDDRRTINIPFALSPEFTAPIRLGGVPLASLAAVVAAFPVPTAELSRSNTLSLGRRSTDNSACSPTVCPSDTLQVAFEAGQTLRVYVCDRNRQTGALSACVDSGPGRYEIGTGADGATPLLKFTQLPAVADVLTREIALVEWSGKVWPAERSKTRHANFRETRLNRVAFEALAAALGFTPPAFAETVSPFLGKWSVDYVGLSGARGTCGTVVIDAMGGVVGECFFGSETDFLYPLGGSVSTAGALSGQVFEAGPLWNLSGTLSGSTGSGQWMPIYANLSFGTWTATKQP